MIICIYIYITPTIGSGEDVQESPRFHGIRTMDIHHFLQFFPFSWLHRSIITTGRMGEGQGQEHFVDVIGVPEPFHDRLCMSCLKALIKTHILGFWGKCMNM